MLTRLLFFGFLSSSGLLFILPDALAETPATYNRINISANASAELENDKMIVTLLARASDQSSAEAAKQANGDMQWALDKLKSYPKIKTKTLNYRTFPTYRERNIVGWQVEQGLRLESTEMSLLATVTGELQSRLNVTGMQYDASPEKVTAKENDIIRSAIEAFEERALIVSNSLGARSYRIVNLRVDTQNRFQGFPRMEAMSRSLASEAAAPNVQAGEKSLTASVNGEIELIKREDNQ